MASGTATSQACQAQFGDAASVLSFWPAAALLDATVDSPTPNEQVRLTAVKDKAYNKTG